ncbi:hypothetical protein LJB42_004882 [Komagataella kurtzmanii]|nr:hypothetical protein LJB42_004882 [Komagataella kurtzmanii]
MPIKGRFTKRKPKRKDEPNRPSPTQFIKKIASLKKQTRRDEALDVLHELAVVVSPLMKENGFTVGLLCEMFPKNASLLGLNVNMGSKIMIRLRPSHNMNLFLPKREIIGTMLHELTHNRFSAHDVRFYDFLEGLKSRFFEIQVKGSLQTTGYVNFSEVLSGNAARGQLIQKEKEKGQRLGGNKHAKPMRVLILEAAEKRMIDSKWCGGASNEEGLPKIEDLMDDEEAQHSELKEENTKKVSKTVQPSKKKIVDLENLPNGKSIIIDLTNDDD